MTHTPYSKADLEQMLRREVALLITDRDYWKNSAVVFETERDQARERCRRLFEALDWALIQLDKRACGEPWEQLADYAEMLEELRPHVAKEQG